MTKKLFFSLCLLSGAAFGQNFTSANEFAIGDSQAMFLCDSAAPSYATTVGNGVSWDYSSYMKMPNPNRTYQVTANANTGFPNSNKVVSVQGILDTYLLTDALGRKSEGFQFVDATLGTVTANFSAGDNMDVMDYTFALDNSISDVFSGTVTGTGIINPACSGTSVSTFDAIGTLTLAPGVVKTNVQRHHLYSELNATSILGPVILKIDQFEYYDFTGSELPVLSFTSLKIFLNGNAVTTLKFLLNTEEPASFVGLDENKVSDFAVYPNPATEELTVSSANFDGTENFTITDITGKVNVKSNSTKINIQGLNPGVYFVSVEKNGVVSQQKFIKK